MEFPRLNDTAFPHLDDADPYRFRNTFDYSQWQADCRIKMLNVPWHADYKHAVAWDSDAARDEWFDSQAGESIELGSDSRRVMDAVPVPLTYQQAARYNYCMMEAEYPSIDYSGTPRRLYYFIVGLEYRSPNATVLHLQLDAWTTYINHVSIPYLFLARGHAPMDAVDADTYLTDPLEHSMYLGSADVDFGTGADNVRSLQVHDFGDADKVVCFASVVPYDEFQQVTAVGAASPGTEPTFSNTGDRYGYQLRVNGYEWRTAYDYSRTSMPSRPLSSAAGNVPQYWIYGIPAVDLFTGNGMRILQDVYPFFIKACVACFILPDDIVDARFIAIKNGLHFYEVSPRDDTGFMFDLDKAAFGYPSEYADIAKLYSMPYSHLQVSDDAGRSMDIRIEDISGNGLQAVNQLNLAAPFLDWNVVFSNVGASGTTSVEWVKLDGSRAVTDLLDAGYSSILQIGIPTYALLLSREKETQSGGYASAMRTRNNALVAYTNNVRNLNTARENVRDSNATMITNTNNSASTNSSNVALSVATSSANVAAGNASNTDITGYQRALNNAYCDYDNYLQSACVDATIEAASATTSSAAAFGIGGGIVTGAISGGMTAAGGSAAVAGALAGGELGAVAGPGGIVAGIVVGGLLGAVAPSIQAAGSATNNNILITSKQTMADAAIQNNINKTGSGNANASAKTVTANNLATTTTNNNNALATAQTNNNNALSRTNAANISAVNNSQSEYSRNVSVLNAQDTLRNVQDGYDFDLLAAKQNSPVAYGAFAGDPTADAYGRKVVSMRVITESPTAIKQAGDWFLRYGYAYNGIWELDSWTDEHAFRYWQAGETWINGDSQVSDDIKTTIDAILQAGVTVWKDADTVGRVTPYGR